MAVPHDHFFTYASGHDSRVARTRLKLGHVAIYSAYTTQSNDIQYVAKIPGKHSTPYFLHDKDSVALVYNKAKGCRVIVINHAKNLVMSDRTMDNCAYALLTSGRDEFVLLTTEQRLFKCKESTCDCKELASFPDVSNIFRGNAEHEVVACVHQSDESISLVDVNTATILVRDVRASCIHDLQIVDDRIFLSTRGESNNTSTSIQSLDIRTGSLSWATKLVEPFDQIVGFVAARKCDRMLVCVQSPMSKRVHLEWSQLSTGKLVGTMPIEPFQIAYSCSGDGAALIGDYGWWNVESLKWTSFAAPCIART